MSSEPLVSPDSGLWVDLAVMVVVGVVCVLALGAGAVWKRWNR